MNIFKGFLGTLFPDTCVGCKKRGSLLCADCMQRIDPATAPMQSFAVSIYAYHDFRVKRLVWLLKYRNTRHAAKVFAPAMAAALTELLGEEHHFLGSRNILLVPVPLSKNRFKKRGYNQAELLARGIAALLPGEKISIDTQLLKKTVETTPQADIKKKSIRLSNLGDCFEVVKGRKGNGEVVVLIDDVTTTGATLAAARKALRAAGLTKVYALTAAH